MLIEELEKKIFYNFKNKAILLEALTHKSAGKKYNYEKLEFLGDRVLGFIIAEKLNTIMNHEKLSDIHLKFEALTNENFLSKVANSINLSKYIITQSGTDGDKFKKNNSILSDVMEAIIGAIYIDGNIGFVKSFIEKFFNINNKKSNYELIKKEGPDHNPFFIIKVTAMGFFSEGKGKTIKLAELDAAKNILKIIREQKY